MAKKKLKKLLKAALIGGAGLLAARGLGKRGLKGKADKLTEGDIGIGQRSSRVDDYNYKPKFKYAPYDAEADRSIYSSAKGGRVPAKHGGKVKSMGVAKRGGGVAKR